MRPRHLARRTAAGAPLRSAVIGAPHASPRPQNVHHDRGRRAFTGRILWTEARRLAGCGRRRPENGRLGDGMGDVLGYARVSTADQDVAGQTMRLTQAGAIKVFTDVRS